jgi:hypothetical protein
MKQRCSDTNSSDYGLYGGKGITVCGEWKDNYATFKTWAHENGYRRDLTIERKDHKGHYCPENCTWASSLAQARNRSNNHRISYNGETKTLAEWAEVFDIESSLIRYRLRVGWLIEDALTIKPSNAHNGGSH